MEGGDAPSSKRPYWQRPTPKGERGRCKHDRQCGQQAEDQNRHSNWKPLPVPSRFSGNFAPCCRVEAEEAGQQVHRHLAGRAKAAEQVWRPAGTKCVCGGGDGRVATEVVVGQLRCPAGTKWWWWWGGGPQHRLGARPRASYLHSSHAQHTTPVTSLAHPEGTAATPPSVPP